MFFQDVAGQWQSLAVRLDRSAALQRWRVAEPDLCDVASFDELLELSGSTGVDDRLLGALVRIAAFDGGGDPDAALVVLHLLRRGVCRLARQMSYRGPEVMAVVVSEVVCVIRSFPWRRRTAGFAVNILLDAKHVLWRGELAPVDPRTWWVDAVVLAGNPTQLHLDQPADDGAEVPAEVELADLLLTAVTRGAVSADDVRLLLDTERGRGYGTQSRQRTAAAHGISERTLRRRRERALAALRDVAGAAA